MLDGAEADVGELVGEEVQLLEVALIEVVAHERLRVVAREGVQDPDVIR